MLCQTLSNVLDIAEKIMNKFQNLSFYKYSIEDSSSKNIKLARLVYLLKQNNQSEEIELLIEYGKNFDLDLTMLDIQVELLMIDYGLKIKTQKETKEKEVDNWSQGLNLIRDKLGM